MKEFNRAAFQKAILLSQETLDEFHAADDYIVDLEIQVAELKQEFDATQNEWTPITSVEQMEMLVDGNYEFNNDSLRYPASVIKQSNLFMCRWRKTSGVAESHCSTEEIPSRYESYRLIRAFEAAPAIPSDAIENTLENRKEAEYGEYLFCSFADDVKMLTYKGGFTSDSSKFKWSIGAVREGNDSFHFDCYDYFYALDCAEMLAALEALAKGER